MKAFLPCIAFVFLATLAPEMAPGADIAPLPDDGFNSARYEKLWTQSPFAVASAETVVPDSPDYSLVGIAEFDGVSYASLIDKKSQEHFLLAGDEPDHGLALVSVTRGKDIGGTSAVVKKNGQLLTLKLEKSAATATSSATAESPSHPMSPVARNAPHFPSALHQEPQTNQAPPTAIIHRRIIHVPPQPGLSKTQIIHQFTPQPR